LNAKGIAKDGNLAKEDIDSCCNSYANYLKMLNEFEIEMKIFFIVGSSELHGKTLKCLQIKYI
jgi:hypothetical protein